MNQKSEYTNPDRQRYVPDSKLMSAIVKEALEITALDSTYITSPQLADGRILHDVIYISDLTRAVFQDEDDEYFDDDDDEFDDDDLDEDDDEDDEYFDEDDDEDDEYFDDDDDDDEFDDEEEGYNNDDELFDEDDDDELDDE